MWLQPVLVASYLSHNFIFLKILDNYFFHCLDKPTQKGAFCSCICASLLLACIQTALFTYLEFPVS